MVRHTTAALAALSILVPLVAGCSSGGGAGATSAVGAPPPGGAFPTGGGTFQPHAAVTTHPRLLLDAPTLGVLRGRAAAATTEWRALRDYCDSQAGLPVEWPDGRNAPDDAIGAGYQGHHYAAVAVDLGLCHQVTLTTDAARSQAYGAKAADVLRHMSEPSGPHRPDTKADGGYGIRNYAIGMALAYDWSYDVLGDADRRRVADALVAWVQSYESDGFEHEFPQGNYFAAYYSAKCLAALALSGDDGRGDQQWTDWLTRVHGTMVQPYYAANLATGGWPEGWNYGPQGTINMSLPILAVRTARGIDLVGGAKPYAFPVAAPRFVAEFTWPNLTDMDDSSDNYGGDHPDIAGARFFTVEAGLLGMLGDTFAPLFHSLTRVVRARTLALESGDNQDELVWNNFLFWDDRAPETDYHTMPTSYAAHGIDDAAARSDWSGGATWVAFKAGPYINYASNGEEYPDKGSFAVVRGGRPLVVNTPGWLKRNLPGQSDGESYQDPVDNDVFFGSPARAEIFNIFYTDRPITGEKTVLRSDGARTSLAAFDDGGRYVFMRGSHLEDLFPRDVGDSPSPKTIVSWTRDVVYLRPGLTIVYDRTAVTDTSIDQWMAYHVSALPQQVGGDGSGVDRFDVGSGGAYAGTVQTVLPVGHAERSVDVFNSHKVWRLELRPRQRAAQEQWLTVFDTATSPAAASVATRLSAADGGVEAGHVQGVALAGGSGNAVVLEGTDAPGASPGNEIRYRVAAAAGVHVVGDLPPASTWTVRTTVSGGILDVDITAGGARSASAAGVLSFTTATDGSVST